MGKKIIDVSMKEEIKLVRLAQAGNRDALNSLLISYMPFMEKSAMKYIQYGLEKEDMVQEGLIWLSNYVMKHNIEKSKSKFRIYVYMGIEDFFQKMAAHNNLMSQNKFSKEISYNDEFVPRVVYLEDVIKEIDKEELLHGEMDPVFDKVSLSFVYDYINILVKRGELSEKQVKIMKLHIEEQLKFTEIGKIMGRSEQVVCENYNRAVRKLVNLANCVSLPRVELVTVKETSFDWNNVWKLLEEIFMTDDMMDMLWLYFENGLSYGEVALRCGVTVYQVKTTFKLFWEIIVESSIKSDLITMFGDSKTVKEGFTKRRMLEKKHRKQMDK